jgi:hypothetical protein
VQVVQTSEDPESPGFAGGIDAQGAPLSLRRNFSWTLAGNVVYAGCQWGMLVALAKLHLQSAQTRHPMRVVGDLPRTREASGTALALPLYSHMSDDDQERVLREVESLLGSHV